MEGGSVSGGWWWLLVCEMDGISGDWVKEHGD